MGITFAQNLIDDIDRDIVIQFAKNLSSKANASMPKGWAYTKRLKVHNLPLPKVGTLVNIRDRPYLLAGKVSLSTVYSPGSYCIFGLFKFLPYIYLSKGILEDYTTSMVYSTEDLEDWENYA